VKTVKGYGVPGAGGERKNTTHQLKSSPSRSNADPDMAPERSPIADGRGPAAIPRSINFRSTDKQLGKGVYKPADHVPNEVSRERRKALAAPTDAEHHTPSVRTPARPRIGGTVPTHLEGKGSTKRWLGSI